MVYPDVEDYAFSPDSSQLLILYNVYSEYYEKSLKLQTYLWDLDIGILYDFGVLEGVSGSLNPRFTWSPDGQKLLFFLTELTDEGEYIIRVYTTDLETGEKLTLTGDPLFTGENYFYITNLYWR
jgi:Tol biopolymer transport system component